MADFTLKQLETFVTVAELNSFTRAAEELYLTQSTISSHISALEAALDARLFARDTRRNIQLTSDGQRLYPAAKRVLSECRDLRAIQQGETIHQPLSLGASTVPAQYLLPDLLSGFLKGHADCRYLLKRGDSAQIHELLKAGEISIGFVGAEQDPELLTYEALAVDRLVMVTENSARYRALHSSGVWGRDLLGEPTVAREEGSGTDRTVNAYMHQIGFQTAQLQIVARIDNPETIKGMVARGAGVSVLSALAVQEEVQSGKLLAFEMDEEGLQRKIYMIRRKGELLGTTEQQFCQFVKRAAKLHSNEDVID
ncbi:MAG: LysR family transcriptional regulator [Oscillibacter sp.]|nr:LysR family transcriptional regulator [Oscillibacter sp.]